MYHIGYIIALPVSSFAATKESSFEAATSLVSNAVRTSSYGWSVNSSYYLGEEVPTYEYVNGTLTPSTNTSFFPVFKGTEISGILTAVNRGLFNESYNFSKSFANELNTITASGQKEYSIILNGRQVFAICEGVATEIAFYDIQLLDGQEDIDANDINSILHVTPFDSANANLGNSRNVKTLLPISIPATRADDTMFSVLNVDEWLQPTGSNLCWAATTWCVGEYSITGSLHDSPTELAASVGYTGTSGRTLPQVIEYLFDVYSLEYTQVGGNNPISMSAFETEIDQFQPFPMVWWRDNSANEMAHMVTACGYCKNSSGVIDEIGVMDSLEGEIIWILAADDGSYTEQMGNLTYTWRQQAIRQ